MQIDLKQGVIPISKAASALAALIARARSTGAPIVVTQKGFPTAVILSVDSYLNLCAVAEGQSQPAPLDTDDQRIAEARRG
jgi:prevent-host-death family protein